ncbi:MULTISPECIES: helix-turn-helix transcriptional regulator [unclassified Thiocapsa]|uniref:helix-turn-helix transcriptional regulator n=1 Tax=unclassified Thiocapsa TaxID=2641286 RepID=UPI0035AFDD69
MINRALRTMRLFHDMTQKELADRLDVSKSHLSEIESGKKTPTLALLKRYSEAFDIPTSSIIFFSESLDGEDPRVDKARVMISSKILALLEFIAERSGRAHVEG